MNLYGLLNKRSGWLLTTAGFFLVLLIGFLDYFTGAELSFSIFYLFPIGFVTWYAGRGEGIVLAVLSGFVWLAADIMAGHVYSRPFIPYWNAIVRAGFFTITIIILSILKRELESKTNLILMLQNALLELRNAEAELKKKSEELARSNTELAQFAFVAAHDLREPLLSIGGYIRLLQRRYRNRLDAEAQILVASAIEGSMRMEDLINGLLNYAQVENKEREFAATDCNTVLDKAITNLGKAIVENDAVVTRDSLPVVGADHVLLTQLFQNLIANALKFKGVERPQVHVSVEKKANQWIFSARDNGIGIDQQHFDRIFEMFQKVHSRTKYPGSGIGLALCKKIVEIHGGQIWLESRPGEGTTFYFTIPADGRIANI